MKQETKQTIDWIKKQINLAKETCIDPCHKDGYPEYEADYEKAMNFLDSLPEIESHLCKGGYIQDKNGIPCCDGDKILFCGEYNGILRFGFMDELDKEREPIPHFWFDFCGIVPTISGSIYFEKVE